MSEQEMQQLYAEVRTLESYYTSLSQEESMMRNAYADAMSSAATMRATEGGKSHDTLVSVGSGVFFDAHMADTESVILDVGANIAIRKSRKYAMDYVESRIKEINVAVSDIIARKQEIAMRMQQNRQRIQQIANPAPESAAANV